MKGDLVVGQSRQHRYLGIETNSLQHRGHTLKSVFRMSVYNIVRKRKVLETNLKSEEIPNFYPIFFLYFSTFIVISFRTLMFSFCESYFRLVGLFYWGYARTQFLLSVSWNRYVFTLAGYQNEKSATNPALSGRLWRFVPFSSDCH